jgi:hypothetical protein
MYLGVDLTPTSAIELYAGIDGIGREERGIVKLVDCNWIPSSIVYWHSSGHIIAFGVIDLAPLGSG